MVEEGQDWGRDFGKDDASWQGQEIAKKAVGFVSKVAAERNRPTCFIDSPPGQALTMPLIPGHAPPFTTMDIDGFLPPDDPATVFFIGQHETRGDSPVSLDILGQAQSLGYDFITTPLTTAFFHVRVFSQLRSHLSGENDTFLMPLISPLSPTDTTLSPNASNSALMGVISPWIDLASADPVIAHVSRQVLSMEVAFAAFCGISNVIIHGPASAEGDTQYARAIAEALGLGPYIQLHILLPMAGELETEGETTHLSELCRPTFADDVDENADKLDEYIAWELWNTIRSVCNYSQKLSLALELPRQLPSTALQSRWFSESIRFAVFPHTTFLRNAKGYPVLSKPHQQVLSRFATLRFPPWLLLSDVGQIRTESNGMSTPEPTPAEAATKAKERLKDPTPHLRYLRHLQQTQPPRPPILRFGQGYQDYLQSPLQPLTDNLESITYEVFEKDPVKYEWYEGAVAAALDDLNVDVHGSREIAVAVVGAGRGPLVTRSLLASQKTGIRIKCWAVEKNPNAYVLLQGRNATDPLWNGQVNVVKSDMRHWAGPCINGEVGKVDILVSELLGSFADNELSPECLDGVQHVLHPDHGINIPQSYNAHLTPIATPRLFADILSRPGTEKWEVPYVVMLHQYDYLSKQNALADQQTPNVKEAWSFSHPAPQTVLDQSRLRASGSVDIGGWVGGNGSNEHNVRSCKLSFNCHDQGVCHGLAGYFETVLYAGNSVKVELSTNPVNMEEKSKDMISWFPIFFPLKAPLYIPSGSEMEVSMWRQTDDRGVWYEWIVEVFERSGQTGKKRRLGMSELHSSRKHACLM